MSTPEERGEMTPDQQTITSVSLRDLVRLSSANRNALDDSEMVACSRGDGAGGCTPTHPTDYGVVEKGSGPEIGRRSNITDGGSDMQDLTEIKRQIEHVQFSRGATVPADSVLDRIILPLLRLVEAKNGGRWITLSEAMDRTRKSIAYFSRPQKRLGNRSRLELWERSGDAEQAEIGAKTIWLVNPDVLGVLPTGSAPQEKRDPQSAATALLQRNGINQEKRRHAA